GRFNFPAGVDPLMPMRTRTKSIVLSACPTDLTPLWPPADEPNEIFILPSGKSSSSCTTTSVSAAFLEVTVFFIGPPELFMYTLGYRSVTFLPKSLPLVFSFFSIAANISRPTLWRVPTYSSPGLPRPASVHCMKQIIPQCKKHLHCVKR